MIIFKIINNVNQLQFNKTFSILKNKLFFISGFFIELSDVNSFDTFSPLCNG